MRSVRVLLPGIVLAIASGCADYNWKLPGVYRIPVQQGTVIEQSMVNKLKPGMGKDQVKFILGTPVIVDPFHSERWEYIYTFKKGSDRVREQRHITLHFDDNEQLAYISGDIEAVDRDLLAEPEAEPSKQPDSFVVPDRAKPGIFSRIISGKPDYESEDTSAGDDTSDDSGIEADAEEDIKVIEESEDGPAGDQY